MSGSLSSLRMFPGRTGQAGKRVVCDFARFRSTDIPTQELATRCRICHIPRIRSNTKKSSTQPAWKIVIYVQGWKSLVLGDLLFSTLTHRSTFLGDCRFSWCRVNRR